MNKTFKCPRNPFVDCYAISEEEAKACLAERICQAQGDKPKHKSEISTETVSPDRIGG